MALYEVTSKPAAGVRTWTEEDEQTGGLVEREAIRVTILEAEDEAEARVRVNDSNRAVAQAAEKGTSDAESYKVTKITEI